MGFILIDGSYGEGGGQILRSAVALSALIMKPIKVINIRAKRSNPGLRPQHLTAVKAVATISNAMVKGLSIGSQTIEFIPKSRRAGSFEFDVGTAGSISLVLQALLPASMFAPGPCTFKIRGGTDVMKAPPIDYIRFVLTHWLKLMGYNVVVNLHRRGHYPRGGGIVTAHTEPVEYVKPIVAIDFGKVVEIRGISHAVKLPKHVAERQAKAAVNTLKEAGFDVVKIDIEWYPPERDYHLGPGSAIVLWAISDKGFIIGSDSLGMRGKRAEVVGREAAEGLLKELEPNAAVDSHMGDMLIPFMAVARGTSRIKVSKLTLHTITNIHVAEKILGVNFRVKGSENEPALIEVNGLGLSRST
ncbi:MAG: RNA 3'-phosphate cyclase [Thermoprotei archaeon]|nr:MAG: RNA 3'-phosphate cyclase [Thermoprotei archaeon]RLF19578.1 MAG: RNA 3'-phosphate cyclase [Thermoprotei archaeon]